MKIILAEDNPVDGLVIKDLLSSTPHDVEYCSDGKTALDKLMHQTSPVIAILDWQMPGISGLQICEELIKNNLKTHVYLIICSGTSEKNDIFKALRSGADDYISKPIQQTELLARLRTAERILGYRDALDQKEFELRELIRRNNMLSALALSTEEPPVVENKFKGDPSFLDGTSLGQIYSILKIDQIVCRTFSQLGCKHASSILQMDANFDDMPKPLCVGWAPIVFNNYWMDIAIVATAKDARSITEQVLKKDMVSDDDIQDFLAEATNVVLSGFHKELEENNIPSLLPEIPQSLTSLSFNDYAKMALGIAFKFEFQSEHVFLRLFLHDDQIRQKDYRDLANHDILCEPAISLYDNTVKLIPEATPLNKELLKQIGEWVFTKTLAREFKVLEPSLLARQIKLEKLLKIPPFVDN
ncbi:MAG: hypothetical protein A2Y14_02305 [Verrucomicrobia bacterium GWF2_51_19]|nr:MAG: hypothetical protein A2Y14_02305 [Verrucomicrobia bacterium GWF2_51_19]HCJ11912.1 hypothetical protein [Opitutae bacterium]